MTVDTKKVLRDHFDALVAEKEALYAASAPVRAKIAEKSVAREKLTADIRKLAAEARAIEGQRIFELSEEISRLALAMGGKRMSQGTADATKG